MIEFKDLIEGQCLVLEGKKVKLEYHKVFNHSFKWQIVYENGLSSSWMKSEYLLELLNKLNAILTY